jgi:SAM-dependent methyltransferase
MEFGFLFCLPVKVNMTCTICGNQLIVRYPQVIDPQTGDKFSIYTCVNCGLGHTKPEPDDMGRYYGRHYYGGRHGFTDTFCAKRRLRLVSSMFDSCRSGRLLDIGCGEGVFLSLARKSGWEVFGTERNPELARKAGLTVEKTIEDIHPFAPFDCITLWHSLEHLSDPGFTLKRLSALLKPRGSIVIAVPDFGGLQAGLFGDRWLHLDVPRHLYHFDNRSLTLLLDSAGLSPKKRWHQEFEYDLLGWSQSVLNKTMHVPNAFFDILTGRTGKMNKRLKYPCMGIGILLSVFAVPAVFLSTFVRKGGTLIIAAS